LTTRQHSFYMEDADWTKLRHHCLDAGISVTEFVTQTVMSAIDPAYVVTKSHQEGDQRVIEEVQLMEVSLVKEPPHPSMVAKLSAKGSAGR
jgi:hypothetical protein